MRKVVLPSVYLGNLEYFALLANSQEVLIDLAENFQKQTYRNRCVIYGPNGVQNLIVPLRKKGQRTTMKTTEIMNDDKWQKLHWRSLEAAYRSSPYFEYYEDRLKPFYEKEYTQLHQLNNDLLNAVLGFLKIDVTIAYTEIYKAEHQGYEDFRGYFTPKTNQEEFLPQQPYIQVFGDRHGFKHNLSILDALFNLGPQTLAFLGLPS